MRPDMLSDALRTDKTPHLARRRGIAALALVASGSMGLISLYQLGIIAHLPEPPLAWLNADKVDASAEAYRYLAMPDGALGLASYSATLMLAAAGEPGRARTRPWLPLTLAAKTLFDAANAVKLTGDQWTKHRAICMWCMVAAAASVVTVPLAVPEALAALRTLRRAGSLKSALRVAA